MKKFMVTMLLFCFIIVSYGQNGDRTGLWSKHNKDKTAGDLLIKSGRNQLWSYACFVASTGFAIMAVDASKPGDANPIRDLMPAIYMLSGIAGIGGIILQISSIIAKRDAGAVLNRQMDDLNLSLKSNENGLTLVYSF